MDRSEGTVLLVEDDANDVMLTARAFEQAGFVNPLQVVPDGEAAIAYLSGEGRYADRQRYPFPILLLLDLKLPRVSGFEVLAWLRAVPDIRRLPVIVLTSSEQSPDINRAYDQGANSYLVKPVEFDDLKEMIEKFHIYWVDLNAKPTLPAQG